MSISSINYGSSLLGQSVQNISNQLSNLSTELSSGVKSPNYAGMGVNEGFAIAARSQLADIAAFGNTITGVNTIIDAANTALQSLSTTVGEVQSEAAATPQNLGSNGQTIGQQNALAQLSAIVGVMNTQVGNRYIFSGTAINTPAMASADDILNGTGTQAGLKQVISERAQADGVNGLGRLVVSPSASVPITVSEDVAGSPFGLKLSAVSSSLTNTTVSGPSGSPASISINMTGNPNPGDQISVVFKLPDGTSETVQLTASNSTPLPANGFAIDPTSPANTSANLNAALNAAIGTLAGTSLAAASAVAAGNDFFNTNVAVGNAAQNRAAAAITGATALSGTAPDSLTTGFSAGDTITVNGQTLTFVASGASGNNQINVTDNVQTLLSKIDALTGTSTPSTVTNGILTLNGNSASTLSVTSSNTAALAALGFAGGSATATPLRVSGPSFSSATSLTNGSADTVAWYTGNSGPGSARSTATVRVDSSQTVQFGAQANEQAIRQAVQNIAVYAAVVNPPSSADNDSIATGKAVNNQATPQAPIAGATALSGTSGTNSLSTSFVAGDTITVNGQTITFKASGATGDNQINVTDNVQTLLQKIDAISGTSIPSSINGGVITLHTDKPPLSVTSSNAGAFAALGFSSTVTATNPNARIAALSQRIGTNLTPQAGQQTISDIQTDFATAQTTMKDAQARQTQTQTALQNLISDTEGIDQNQVASEILQLQTNLQASYQTTAMLSQLSLVKFLPVA